MADAKPLPPVEVLREHFSYDPETGIVTRLKKTYRNQKVGEVVGGLRTNGYMQIRFDYRNMLLHRLIWKLVKGVDPAFIDHVNRNRSDNRWANLRECTLSQNQGNRHSNGKFLPGAKPSREGRWFVNNLGTHLGMFDTEQEAHDAYVKWHREYYGEFSVYAA